jgi:hypothetical protein
MTQDHDSLDKKRQKALDRLRNNRGKERSGGENRQKGKGDTATLLLKEYRDSYRQEKKQIQESEGVETPEIVQDPEQLPRLQKASDRLKEKEEQSSEAVQRLKDMRQRLKQAKQARQAKLQSLETEDLQEEVARESTSELPAGKPVKRQQLRQDVLSADFFKSASQWLGTIRSEPHLSSTSLEEIESLYDQAKYRYKVLKILLEDTQRELDGFEAYLRMAQSSVKPSD